VLCVPRAFADALAGDLIAHYRFDTNGSDSLGRSPPFVVTNGDQSRAGVTYAAAFAVTNAPFTNGVLYVNGRYEPNGHFVNYLGTAPIKDLRYESFTVGLDFYPLPKKRSRYSFNRLEAKLDSWTRGRYARWRGIDANLYNTDNILTGGYSYRWIGFNREDGLLNLTLNNQSFAHRFKDVAVKPGRWHNLICSVDLQRRKILTMFDGHPLEAITLPSDFKLEVAGGPGDPARQIEVEEEILAEALACSDGMSGDDLAQRRQRGGSRVTVQADPRRLVAISAASRSAAIRLSARATPRPAIGNAVP